MRKVLLFLLIIIPFLVSDGIARSWWGWWGHRPYYRRRVVPLAPFGFATGAALASAAADNERASLNDRINALGSDIVTLQTNVMNLSNEVTRYLNKINDKIEDVEDRLDDLEDKIKE